MSAIVSRPGRGPEQTHGAEWHYPAIGGFGRRAQKIQNYDVVRRR